MLRTVLAAALAAGALIGVPAGATSPTQLPVCVDQAAALSSRCEKWARAFNDRAKDGSTVHDVPGGLAVRGDRIYVATTSTVGAAQAHTTVAALSAKNGATIWAVHPPTKYRTDARALTLTPDGATVVVTGTMTYLPNLNATPLVWIFTSAYATANGRLRWATAYQAGGSANAPVAVTAGADRVYVTGWSDYPGYQRDYVEWATLAYSARTGKQVWVQRYGGKAGGQNRPVGLAVSPRGDRVYVAGSSDHPQTTAQFSSDYAAVAYDARTGRRRWTSITRLGSDHAPAGVALSPKGDRLYVTGAATFGTATQPVYGALTVALSTRTGGRAWTARYLAASGQSAAATGIVASPRGDRVYVAATVGQRKQVVAGTLEPSVATITTFALDAKSGHQAWAAAYAPDPGYSAAPTALAVNPQGSTVYLAGVVGPPTLAAAYPVLLAVTSAGKQAWVARYDVRDPGSAGIGLAGFPATPTALVVDRAGANVYDALAYYPAGTGAASTECESAHSAGVAQDCAPAGRTDLVLAYAK